MQLQTRDMDGTPIVELVIPPAIECVPARARRVGGISRIHPHWSALSEAPSVATMPAPHWGPGEVASVSARSAVTFHMPMSTFQSLSVKMGRMMSGIGPHEQAWAEELEVDPQWVTYDLQGLETEWRAGNSYRSDFHGLNAMDGLVAGEIKADWSYFHAASYQPTMRNAERTFDAVGLKFRKIAGTAMHNNLIRRRNVRRAYCDRFTTTPKERTEAVEALLDDEKEVPLARIHTILANDPRTAQQMVHGLLCRRVLAYDLDQLVSRDTMVHAPADPAAWTDIMTIRLSEAA